MDHDAGRFVDNQEVFVLEQNIDRNVFGLRLGRAGSWPSDRDGVAGSGCVSRFRGLTVDGDVPFIDQALERATGDRWITVGQVAIQAYAWLRTFDHELFGAIRHAIGTMTRTSLGRKAE